MTNELPKRKLEHMKDDPTATIIIHQYVLDIHPDAECKKYKCEKHGIVEVIGHRFIGFGDHDGDYCMECWLELITNNCGKLEESEQS